MLAAIESHRESPGEGAPAKGAASLPELFEQHHSRVFRAAYRVTGSATDAEDVLQTVFLRLARRGEDLELGDGVVSYLHRAAVNAALDLLRARKRSRTVDLEEFAGEIAEPLAQGPESRRGAREIATWMRSAVARLSPRAAEIFSLRYFEGYANREIAGMLETSENAVAVILHRSRGKLQKELGPLVGGLS